MAGDPCRLTTVTGENPRRPPLAIRISTDDVGGVPDRMTAPFLSESSPTHGAVMNKNEMNIYSLDLPFPRICFFATWTHPIQLQVVQRASARQKTMLETGPFANHHTSRRRPRRCVPWHQRPLDGFHRTSPFLDCRTSGHRAFAEVARSSMFDLLSM